MTSSVPTSRVPAAAEIVVTIVVGAYTDLLERKELLAYAMSLMCQIDATKAELEGMDPASPLAVQTGEALAIAQGVFDDLKAQLRTP